MHDFERPILFLHRGARLGLFVAAFAVAAGPATATKLTGTYSTPLGTLKISERDGIVTGKAAGSSKCGFSPGTVVLEGTRLDDSVTGTITACKTGSGCSGNVDGMVMLLLTQKGRVMSGAVHVEAGKCGTPIGGDAITLRRASRKAKPKKKPRKTPKKAAQKRAAQKTKPKTGDNGGGDATATPPVTDGSHDDRTAAAGGGDGDDDGVSDDVEDTSPGTEPASSDVRAQAEEKLREAFRLMGTGKMEQARDLLKEAVAIDPSYSQAWLGIGVTYYSRDRYDEALEHYKTAIERDPGNKDAYYNTGCIYALKGDKEQALRYLQIALLNGYVALDTLETDPDLKSLAGDEKFEAYKRGEFF